MIIPKEQLVPINYSLSTLQSNALAAFIQNQSFIGAVRIPIPGRFNAKQSDCRTIKSGIECFIERKYFLPFSQFEELENWLNLLLKARYVKYFQSTTCHAANKDDLRSALRAIGSSILH